MLPELPSKTKSKTQEIKQQRISLLTGIKGDCFLRSVKMEEGAAGEGAPAAAGADDKKIVHTYPLVKVWKYNFVFKFLDTLRYSFKKKKEKRTH